MRRALWICLALAVGAATPAVGSDLKDTLKDLEKGLKGERKTREKSPPAQPASQPVSCHPVPLDPRLPGLCKTAPGQAACRNSASCCIASSSFRLAALAQPCQRGRVIGRPLM